jgi:lipoprotein-anchoring transpeptidase ErfK/SrfK
MRTVALVVLFVAFATGNALAGVVARIDVAAQTMTVSENGNLLYSWKVSTGRVPYRTPRGSFRPIRMHKMWYSRKYDNAPMPYSIFFHGGYAIHGTDQIANLGVPASHGCVRLHPTNAKTLFELVKVYGSGNTRIILQN